jgi:hypothetical protein
MRITVDTQTLRETKPHELIVRFMVGGMITAFTGVIAKKFGPAVGGLFLAFPAILPASVTLINKHERERKERAGLHGTKRGREAASADAAGAAIGSIALFVFAILVWQLLPRFRPWLVLTGITVLWFLIACMAWRIRKAM